MLDETKDTKKELADAANWVRGFWFKSEVFSVKPVVSCVVVLVSGDKVVVSVSVVAAVEAEVVEVEVDEDSLDGDSLDGDEEEENVSLASAGFL